MAGVGDGITLGTPICIMVPNTDQKSQDYSEMALAYRPSHADATYDMKYGIRAVSTFASCQTFLMPVIVGHVLRHAGCEACSRRCASAENGNWYTVRLSNDFGLCRLLVEAGHQLERQ